LRDSIQNNLPGETIRGRAVLKPVYKLKKINALAPLHDGAMTAPLSRLSQTMGNNASPTMHDYHDNSTQ
jgi:hypothetical protein